MKKKNFLLCVVLSTFCQHDESNFNEEMLFLIKYIALNKIAQFLVGKNSLIKIKLYSSFLKKKSKIMQLIFFKRLCIKTINLILMYFLSKKYIKTI